MNYSQAQSKKSIGGLYLKSVLSTKTMLGAMLVSLFMWSVIIVGAVKLF